MDKKIGLYIHIPFCAKRCHYCAFLTFSGNEKLMERYNDHLIVEMAFYKQKKYQVETIYFWWRNASTFAHCLNGQISECYS